MAVIDITYFEDIDLYPQDLIGKRQVVLFGGIFVFFFLEGINSLPI